MYVAGVKTRKEKTRQRIIETASRLFQERGVDGVGVDEIMRACGLTHGGFYAHFASKEALVVEACKCAIDAGYDEWGLFVESIEDETAFAGFVERFLTGDLRKDGPACPMAMLGPDVARRQAVQEAMSGRIGRLVELTARKFECDRDEAMLTLSALVGATLLAAQTSPEDRFGRDVFEAVRRQLLRHRRAPGVAED